MPNENRFKRPIIQSFTTDGNTIARGAISIGFNNTGSGDATITTEDDDISIIPAGEIVNFPELDSGSYQAITVDASGTTLLVATTR